MGLKLPLLPYYGQPVLSLDGCHCDVVVLMSFLAGQFLLGATWHENMKSEEKGGEGAVGEEGSLLPISGPRPAL